MTTREVTLELTVEEALALLAVLYSTTSRAFEGAVDDMFDALNDALEAAGYDIDDSPADHLRGEMNIKYGKELEDD
jgi:hypothetical protein